MASKYVCTGCKYLYDPTKGDPKNKVAANTPFEKLPNTWVCPGCKAPKDKFKPQVVR